MLICNYPDIDATIVILIWNYRKADMKFNCDWALMLRTLQRESGYFVPCAFKHYLHTLIQGQCTEVDVIILTQHIHNRKD